MSVRPPLPARRDLPLGKTALVLAVAVATVAACDAAESYVYTARRYDPRGACLEPYAPVEVVEGPGVAATCPSSCLTVGTEVLVTTMCPPLPTVAVELQIDAAACVAAHAAARSTCGAELDEDAGFEGDSGPSDVDDGGAPDGSATEPPPDGGAPEAGDGA